MKAGDETDIIAYIKSVERDDPMEESGKYHP